MTEFYEMTVRVLSHELLSILWLVALVTMLIAERKYRGYRHILAAAFCFVWLAFEVMALTGIFTSSVIGIAMSRWALLFTALVVSYLAITDIRNGRETL